MLKKTSMSFSTRGIAELNSAIPYNSGMVPHAGIDNPSLDHTQAAEKQVFQQPAGRCSSGKGAAVSRLVALPWGEPFAAPETTVA
jgi:hypothetical protein